jgi:pyruvate kinase
VQSTELELRRVVLRCLDEIDALLAAAAAGEASRSAGIGSVHEVHHRGAVNLVHYVAVRRRDIRRLQADLASLGVSSLSHLEQSVMSTLRTVRSVLARLLGEEPDASMVSEDGTQILERNAERLLGPVNPSSRNRIMVTLPSEAAHAPALVAALVDAGMDIARINCAHDDSVAWQSMAAQVRSRARGTLVAMDLAGPKLRTGPIQSLPRVAKISPERDRRGRVIEPALVGLVNAGELPADLPPTTAALPVARAGWLSRRTVGERLHLRDARKAHRRWTVVARSSDWCVVEAHSTVFVESGLTVLGEDADATTIGSMGTVEQAHRVRIGDTVVLVDDDGPAPVTPDGSYVHRIGCTLPEAFRDCRPGERVLFDDGKIGGRIVSVDRLVGEIVVAVEDSSEAGVKLRAAKGINLPDSELDLPALTSKDVEDLAAIVDRADLVELSFVRTPADVRALRVELSRLGGEHVGIVLKIENRQAFEHLPELLLEAMRHERVGVMIARGDLAVEIGFERLAEVQEEIMWLCEAAHVPVIWATEVLDTMARTGRPSRAEITDAGRAHRAECVMLNKGPHIVEVIRSITSILGAMAEHQTKKHHLLRRLTSWDDFGSAAGR